MHRQGAQRDPHKAPFNNLQVLDLGTTAVTIGLCVPGYYSCYASTSLDTKDLGFHSNPKLCFMILGARRQYQTVHIVPQFPTKCSPAVLCIDIHTLGPSLEEKITTQASFIPLHISWGLFLYIPFHSLLSFHLILPLTQSNTFHCSVYLTFPLTHIPF